MRIKADTLMVMADGQKAIFLKNTAGNGGIRLERLCIMSLNTEPSRKLGRDRPGHSQIGSDSHRTSFEQPDYHQIVEDRFLGSVAKGITQFLKLGGFQDIMLIAEPRAMGILRSQMDKATKEFVRSEITKDYLKTKIPDLETYLNQRAPSRK